MSNKALEDTKEIKKYTTDKEYAEIMLDLITDNLKQSRKMAKILLRELSYASEDEQIEVVEKIFRFVGIKDSYKIERFEMVLGIPQINNQKEKWQRSFSLGLERTSNSNDAHTVFESPLNVYGVHYALLTEMYLRVKVKPMMAFKSMEQLIKLCLDDEEIA